MLMKEFCGSGNTNFVFFDPFQLIFLRLFVWLELEIETLDFLGKDQNVQGCVMQRGSNKRV